MGPIDAGDRFDRPGDRGERNRGDPHLGLRSEMASRTGTRVVAVRVRRGGADEWLGAARGRGDRGPGRARKMRVAERPVPVLVRAKAQGLGYQVDQGQAAADHSGTGSQGCGLPRMGRLSDHCRFFEIASITPGVRRRQTALQRRPGLQRRWRPLAIEST